MRLMRDRAIYALVGGLIASLVAWLLRRWIFMPPFLESCITLAGGFALLAWAERTGRVKDPEDLNRPLSVFDAPKQR